MRPGPTVVLILCSAIMVLSSPAPPCDLTPAGCPCTYSSCVQECCKRVGCNGGGKSESNACIQVGLTLSFAYPPTHDLSGYHGPTRLAASNIAQRASSLGKILYARSDIDAVLSPGSTRPAKARAIPVQQGDSSQRSRDGLYNNQILPKQGVSLGNAMQIMWTRGDQRGAVYRISRHKKRRREKGGRGEPKRVRRTWRVGMIETASEKGEMEKNEFGLGLGGSCVTCDGHEGRREGHEAWVLAFARMVLESATDACDS
ncbi:hypothetical protein AG1IA_07262 [Rhizoctonia solani AG-1 IA]|uniref:Uncharacterized protein n=1 Tax=Thanatephorus cucumeris (strain AG1-IA) TaxID=983506 RepID=L8WPL6_THACA|nr:hypothetical protein AG1IA_07262 [Rhizoctonia solani AG-1 IA]